MRCRVTLLALLGLSFFQVEAASQPARRSLVYLQYCAFCHGEDGQGKTAEGKKAGARDLTDKKWQATVPDSRLFDSMTRGRNRMPAFGTKLTPDEIKALVDEVRRIGGLK